MVSAIIVDLIKTPRFLENIIAIVDFNLNWLNNLILVVINLCLINITDYYYY